eukprot:GHVR01006589.1.p1 GENE.GHVR01006589.1~~GHVR01006589.1.p1  ORF type:complete len:429 (+),score=63.59 GHVR01006589.1:142-1428(+)
MSNQGQHTAPKMTEKEMMAFLQSSIMKDPTLAQKMYNNMMSEGGASLQHVPTLDISNGGNVTGIRVDISKEAVQPKEHVPLVDNSDNKYKGDYVTIEKELGEGMLFYKTIVNQVCPSSKLEDALCACPNCTICLTNLQKEVDNGNDCIVLDRADRCPDWCKYCDDGVFVPKLNVDVGNNGSLPDNTHNNTHDNVKASPPKIDQNTMSASDRLAKVFANVSSAKAKNITTCTTQIPITVQSVPKAAPQYAKQSGQRASFAKPPVRAPSVVGDDTIPKSKPDQREKGVDIDTKLSSIGASISGVINRLAGVERSQVEMNKIITSATKFSSDASGQPVLGQSIGELFQVLATLSKQMKDFEMRLDGMSAASDIARSISMNETNEKASCSGVERIGLPPNTTTFQANAAQNQQQIGLKSHYPNAGRGSGTRS